MDMSQPPSLDTLSWDLLDRYCAGEATADEQAQIEAVLRSAHGTRQALQAIQQGLAPSAGAVKSADIPAMFARLQMRLATGSRLKHVVRHFFGSSPERAIAALMELDDAALTAEQVAQIRQIIDRMRREES